jgi:adenylate cyclase
MAKKQNTQTTRRIFKITGFRISLLLCLILLVLYAVSRPEWPAYERALGLRGLNDILEILENKTLDMRFKWRGEVSPSDNIVIVAVDEKADDELGRWWSSGRRWIAKLLDVLHEGGVAVVGFDLVLDEPDEGAALTAVQELQTYYSPYIQSEDLLGYFEQVRYAHDYDRQLAEAIQRCGNVVLGYYNYRGMKEAAHLTSEDHEYARNIIKRAKYRMIKFPPGITRQTLQEVPHSFGTEVNIPILSDSAKSFGHFNAIPHLRDNYIRRAPLIFEYQGDYYPSLAMEVVHTYLNPPLPPIIHALGKEGGGIVDRIAVGKISIPVDDEGKLLINFYGKGKLFTHYPISDVVLGRIPPDTFRDKIVLLGFTAAIYQDLHSTSFQSGYPGVETHATVIANILRQEFLTRPNVTTFADMLILAVLGVILGLIFSHTRPISGVVAVLLCLLAVTGIAYYAFLVQRVWLNMTYPCLFVLLDYVAITSYKYLTEERRKREVKKAFQHYVAPAVVNQMLNQIDQLQLGGERKQLTALFSDIRGFTSISEKMPPEALVRFLNEYLSAMTRIVLKYNGTVDKYMGDAIMAFYGAPLEQADHAVRACRTAVEMIALLKELRENWETRGLPPMNIGIGINSGDMSVGNMGSEERFDYTIMGDNVNLASRLEGINKQYGTNIVISQFTYTHGWS